MSLVTEAPTVQQTADGLPAVGVPAVNGAQLLSQFPSRALASSWPATKAGRSQVTGRVLAAPFALEHPGSQQHRRLGVLAVVNWLQTQPGDTWQDPMARQWRAGPGRLA